MAEGYMLASPAVLKNRFEADAARRSKAISPAVRSAARAAVSPATSSRQPADGRTTHRQAREEAGAT